MGTLNLIETCVHNVIKFHSDSIKKFHFPCNLSFSELSRRKKSCNFYPSFVKPKIFFILDNEPKLSNLEFPVIKYLTVLELLNDTDFDKFVMELQKLGNRFLVLMESYNKEGIDLLACFKPEGTYYCQQKYLCLIDEMYVRETDLPRGICIRNFITGKDERRYADFYNQVLGFLAGKPVDESFMDAIAARPSFDPEGYFIAEKENRIVGFLAIEKEPWGGSGTGFGYIYQVGVDERLRASGLATALLARAINFAGKKGLNRIGVGVRKSNESAIKFFKKEGFRKVYEVNGYLIDLDRI